MDISKDLSSITAVKHDLPQHLEIGFIRNSLLKFAENVLASNMFVQKKIFGEI